eukprot:TRINITY_DN2691_c0_g1_i1.p1 TRINITY_DN2691_c0_g1~~TRINITY_DN2691_c0_g1_i1.p1  ORF type:complete len:598 (-),score=70.53 TRINITY_DN2691_c0_g1_i1:26-1777(-)
MATIEIPWLPSHQIERGTPIFLEVLQHIKFRSSTEGCVMTIFSSGQCILYPLRPETKGQPESGRSLVESQGARKSAKDRLPDALLGGAQYNVTDCLLETTADELFVATLPFLVDEITRVPVPPSKMLLSPDRRHLMLYGAAWKDQRALLIYAIGDGIPEFNFRLVFYDVCFTFLDACFSPDSQAIVVIPARFPNFVWSYSIKAAATQSGGGRESGRFLPRPVGPLGIFGPAVYSDGLPFVSRKIVSNWRFDSKQHHFITWSDDVHGDFCFWSLSNAMEPGTTHQLSFQYVLRSFSSKLEREQRATAGLGPLTIMDMQFSPLCDQVVALLKRPQAVKTTATTGPASIQPPAGIGMLMIACGRDDGDVQSERVGCWYHLADSLEDTARFRIGWTETLLIGSDLAAYAIIQGKGMYELVNYQYASQFQALFDDFTEKVVLVAQSDKYHRLWIEPSGQLHCVSVNPPEASYHPAWNKLFEKEQSEILPYRGIARRVGYFVNDLSSEGEGRRTGKSKTTKTVENWRVSGAGDAELLTGIHLFRCFACMKTLLKPLQCSACRRIAYCSVKCQQNHWPEHKKVCTHKEMI